LYLAAISATVRPPALVACTAYTILGSCLGAARVESLTY
jgi:hypothetical protein